MQYENAFECQIEYNWTIAAKLAVFYMNANIALQINLIKESRLSCYQ